MPSDNAPNPYGIILTGNKQEAAKYVPYAKAQLKQLEIFRINQDLPLLNKTITANSNIRIYLNTAYWGNKIHINATGGFIYIFIIFIDRRSIDFNEFVLYKINSITGASNNILELTELDFFNLHPILNNTTIEEYIRANNISGVPSNSSARNLIQITGTAYNFNNKLLYIVIGSVGFTHFESLYSLNLNTLELRFINILRVTQSYLTNFDIASLNSLANIYSIAFNSNNILYGIFDNVDINNFFDNNTDNIRNNNNDMDISTINIETGDVTLIAPVPYNEFILNNLRSNFVLGDIFFLNDNDNNEILFFIDSFLYSSANNTSNNFDRFFAGAGILNIFTGETRYFSSAIDGFNVPNVPNVINFQAATYDKITDVVYISTVNSISEAKFARNTNEIDLRVVDGFTFLATNIYEERPNKRNLINNMVFIPN